MADPKVRALYPYKDAQCHLFIKVAVTRIKTSKNAYCDFLQNLAPLKITSHAVFPLLGRAEASPILVMSIKIFSIAICIYYICAVHLSVYISVLNYRISKLFFKQRHIACMHPQARLPRIGMGLWTRLHRPRPGPR